MTADLTKEEPGSARIEGRAQALRPSVPLYRHMLYGANLPNPLDFLALAHIHYMCEDGRSFSVDDLVEALRGEGICAANGKGLIGSKAVYQSVARLRDVGFLHRAQENGGNFGKVSYTFYEFPSLNPHWAPPEGSDRGRSEPVGLSGEAASALPISNLVFAGHTASPDRASADRASADRRNGKVDVFAGETASPDRRSGNAAPPTPPLREEEDSSSRKSSITTVPAGAQATDSAAVTAAAEFLAELPGRWACGRKTAVELAPLLAEAVQAQGWELGTDLVQQLTRRSQARRRAQSVLQERIEDLPRYRAARKALEQERARSAAGHVPGQQLALEGARHDRSDAAPQMPDVTPEQAEQAQTFLLTLTGPWALGPEVAARLAPLLAVKAAERGWAFDERLRKQLMSNPGGGQNYEWLLENRRIATLPDRTRNAARTGQDGMCPKHPQYRAGSRCIPCAMAVPA
ncbi:hypothetical protein ACIOFQ_32875 [[Kitasatospora] papulosa]|uniref:hypothetical protein n=1 Tax=[Kitasatospora] papulosa TaxID=1464011 RepID=UPI0037F397DB